MMKYSRLTLALPILMMALAAQRVDGSTSYYYQGNPFTINITAPFDEVTGYFTVSTSLGDNFSGIITPTSYSFSDGYESLTSGNSTIGTATIQTDNNGNIINWNIDIQATATTDYILTYTKTGNIDEDAGYTPASGAVENLGDPGQWIETPEPTTFVLIAPGLLALVLLARKRTFHANRTAPRLLR